MSEPRAVVVTRPDPGAERPIVVEVPHAGVGVPADVRDELLLDAAAVTRDADLHVDRLYALAPTYGATLVHTEVSRFVVDLNRAEDDVDDRSVAGHPAPKADAPRGLLWRVTTDGTKAIGAPLSMAALERRLVRWFRPYHAALDAEVERLRARFGYVVVLSGHSMPSVGKAGHSDPGKRRADVVPGDLDGTSCAPAMSRLAEEHFRQAGLVVAPNDPYKGGNTTRRHARPSEGIHALQVELNRDLYMDEATFAPRDAPFAHLAALCLALVEKLARFTPPT